MRKKTLKKKTRRLPSIFFIGLLLFLGISLQVARTAQHNMVLGTSTHLVARGGDDSKDVDDSEDESSNSGSGGEGSFGSESSNSDSSNTSGSTSGSSGSKDSSSEKEQSSVSGSTVVVCEGPDGKQFQTTMEHCESLNRPWGRPNFSDELEIEVEEEEEDEEKRTQIRLSEDERIRARTKDGRTRIDITAGGIKTRLEFRDDRVIIKAEQEEDGSELELEDDTILKIDDRLAKHGIKIATAGAEKFVLQRGTAGAITHFPLSVDLATNTLSVNTPSGTKTVTVLPDQAVQNLIAASALTRVVPQDLSEAVNNGSLRSVGDIITLSEKNGVAVYEINGVMNQKLLGFIPVLIEKEVAVSAETGKVVGTEESFSNTILDLLSF